MTAGNAIPVFTGIRVHGRVDGHPPLRMIQTLRDLGSLRVLVAVYCSTVLGVLSVDYVHFRGWGSLRCARDDHWLRGGAGGDRHREYSWRAWQSFDLASAGASQARDELAMTLERILHARGIERSPPAWRSRSEEGRSWAVR